VSEDERSAGQVRFASFQARVKMGCPFAVPALRIEGKYIKIDSRSRRIDFEGFFYEADYRKKISDCQV